jgi:glyoxylase-like metal-dependent hydrolase (beta-lactamase superfamily II)
VGFCLPRIGLPQPVSRLTTNPLSENLARVSGAGGNVLVLTGSDGVVMVDGGAAAHSAELLDAVLGSARERPVLAYFNTHWHYDHTGCNEALGRAGTRIFAHENTKLWLGGDFYVEWEDRRYKPRPPEALPTDTFYTSGETTLAGEDIEYGYLPRAHTDGDIYVFLRKANVLVAGDTVAVGRYPISDYSTGGWPVGMMDASDVLLKLADADTRIVPGQGPDRTRADVQAQRDMLATVTDRLMAMMAKGMSAADMLAAGATREFDADWGDPRLFVTNAYRGLWAHVFALDPRPI